MDPININLTNTTTTQQNLIVITGFIAWSIVGFFFIRIIASRCLPYVTVEEGEAMVVERGLKFNRIITKGPHLVVPFFETLRPVVWNYVDRNEGPVSIETCRIMTRKTKLPLAPVKALTKDSHKVVITFNVIFIISDVKQVVYHGNNLYATIQKLVQNKVKECVAGMLIENMTQGQLQESVEQLIERTGQIFDKKGLSHVECKILDIQYPPTLTEKKERLEEIEMQQELEEKLYKQRSEMTKKEMNEILAFARENKLENDVLGKMLSSVIRMNYRLQ